MTTQIGLAVDAGLANHRSKCRRARLLRTRNPVLWISDDIAGVNDTPSKLIRIGGARPVLALAGRGYTLPLPSGLLVEQLQKAARQHYVLDRGGNETAMFPLCVAEMLGPLAVVLTSHRNPA